MSGIEPVKWITPGGHVYDSKSDAALMGWKADDLSPLYGPSALAQARAEERRRAEQAEAALRDIWRAWQEPTTDAEKRAALDKHWQTIERIVNRMRIRALDERTEK